MSFEFIEAEKANYPTTMLCRTLGVSTSGFYEWRVRRHHPARRTVEDRSLTERITAIHRQSRATYGAPRIHAELRLGDGVRIGRKRIARLMRTAGIQGLSWPKKKGCTRRDPAAELSDDLVNREFGVPGPDRLWVTDITEHRTGEGKIYVAVVLDAWSRRIVGWPTSSKWPSAALANQLQTSTDSFRSTGPSTVRLVGRFRPI